MMRGLVKRRSAAYGLSTLACCLFNNLSIAAPALTTIASFPASGDGAGPQGSLLQIGNIIYGTTQYGGAYGYGSVYSYDLTKKTSAILHSFTGGADGNTPQGGLIALNGTLYGVTSAGGANGLGAVFSVSPTTDVETVVHSFAGSDGSAPMGGAAAPRHHALRNRQRRRLKRLRHGVRPQPVGRRRDCPAQLCWRHRRWRNAYGWPHGLRQHALRHDPSRRDEWCDT